MSKKINILIDGNNHMLKSLGVYKGINNKKLYRLKEEKDDFLKVLATNFISELNRFKQVLGKVVVVVDSRSWRYDYYSDYKGKRKKSEDVNWENYTKLVEYFYKILEKNGIIISRTDGAEGDDLIYAWTNYFNRIKQNCVILSMDGDLSQLVNYDNDCFTVVYDNTYTRFFATKDFYNALDNKPSEVVINDLFSISDEINETEEFDNDIRIIFNNLLKKGVKANIINNDEFILKKLLVGDTGDNILAPYTIVKNNKTYGIGDKTADKIIISYTASNSKFKLYDMYDDKALYNIAESIQTNMKLDKSLVESIYTNLKLNIKLVVLDDKQIPQKVNKLMLEDIENKKNIEIKYESFYNMNILLKGYINQNIQTTRKLF